MDHLKLVWMAKRGPVRWTRAKVELPAKLSEKRSRPAVARSAPPARRSGLVHRATALVAANIIERISDCLTRISVA